VRKHNTNAGQELLFLLRQQRYLYHQLKILSQRQHELAGTNSPELLLEVITGRRKLVEKLRQVNDKLRSVRMNWPKVVGQIEPKHRDQANKMVSEVQQIIGEIRSITPSETVQSLPLQADFVEPFVETQLQ